MFSVIFEVQPRPEQWDAYLGYAKMLRPEHERIEGFVDNIRYRSLTREGWILSLSGCRDEKALVRLAHGRRPSRGAGEGTRRDPARVPPAGGQVTRDSRPPAGHVVREQRLDETETGAGTTVTLIDRRRPADRVEGALALPEGAPLRGGRVVRDYGMFDRREAPQYYPEVRRAEAVRS